MWPPVQKKLASDLLPSLLLAVVAAIPNHPLRYTALGLLLALAILCSIRLNSLSTQMRNLTASIDQTEEHIRRAIAQNPRRHFSLTQQMLRLLKVAKTTSSIRCRILNSETESFGWNTYRLRCSEIRECVEEVKKICTAVELTRETEHQRRLVDDMMEAQFVLTAA
ncbi:hypothetical protein C8R45DRAFT_1005133 [Mycena sanguinolenta]|nr:hypothetical protein C8R45DRAFT_1005133 [Mycena sanguinolenta]